MKLIDTVEYFIQQLEGDIESLSWEIREETGYEDNNIDWLSEQWDTVEAHLNNLKEIKSILENK